VAESTELHATLVLEVPVERHFSIESVVEVVKLGVLMSGEVAVVRA